jgi:NDP-sugar pyrophosphorylase family protein
MIEEVVGDGSAIGIEVAYSPDGPKLLGTGGAIKKALPLIGPEFFVLYGDSFLPIDFAPIESRFREKGKPALMTVFENSGRWDSSNVLFRDGQLIEYNKAAPRPEMSWIDYGLGILSAPLFNQYPEGQAFDLAELYHHLSLHQELSGYVVQERFYEIGTHIGLRETEDYFLIRGKQ